MFLQEFERTFRGRLDWAFVNVYPSDEIAGISTHTDGHNVTVAFSMSTERSADGALFLLSADSTQKFRIPYRSGDVFAFLGYKHAVPFVKRDVPRLILQFFWHWQSWE